MRTLYVAAWSALAVVAAGMLALGYGPDLGRLPDAVHVVGHVLIFGVLAAIVPGSVAVPLVVALVVGAAVELAQCAGFGVMPGPEQLFDLFVDGVGALLGIAVAHRGRASVAVAYGFVLHPFAVAPLGLLGLVYATTRQLAPALQWTAVGIAAAALPVGGFALGMAAGRFSDVDLRRREERPWLFALASAGALLFLAATRDAAIPVARIGIGTALGAVALTAVTTLGLKASGHAAVPAFFALAMAGASPRGTFLATAITLLVSWARVRAGCHSWFEVAAGWGLAALAALPLLLVAR